MDLIQKCMNIVFPPIALIMLLFTLPPYLVFKFLSSIKKFIYIENVSGKVVLITGASSGIGEYLAYEYARRGACLVLVARRENRLREVADKARRFGSPDVMVIRADVSNVEDSKRFVREAMSHFGRLDHLVNNAGIFEPVLFEDSSTLSNTITSIMLEAEYKLSYIGRKLLGSVYGTHFAVPHLRKNQGKIVVISSAAGWFPLTRASIYNASKAALINLYDTLRIEFGSDIGITIVTPGFVHSEMCHEQNVSKLQLNFFPVASTEGCAEAIVNSACRGDRYLIEPFWYSVWFLWKLLCPEVVEWCNHWLTITRPGTLQRDTNANKIIQETLLDPTSVIQPPELKTD